MEVRFLDEKLRQLHNEDLRNHKLPDHVVDNFDKWVSFAHDATAEKDFSGVLGKRFQPLPSDHEHTEATYQILCASSCRITLQLIKDGKKTVAIFVRLEVIS
jgi:plasmid maintenance system killer protein